MHRQFVVTVKGAQGEKIEHTIKIPARVKTVEKFILKTARTVGWEIIGFKEVPGPEPKAEQVGVGQLLVKCAACGFGQQVALSAVMATGEPGVKIRKKRAAEKGPRTYTKTCPKCGKTLRRSARGIKMHIARCGDPRYINALLKANRVKMERHLSRNGGSAQAATGTGGA